MPHQPVKIRYVSFGSGRLNSGLANARFTQSFARKFHLQPSIATRSAYARSTELTPLPLRRTLTAQSKQLNRNFQTV